MSAPRRIVLRPSLLVLAFVGIAHAIALAVAAVVLPASAAALVVLGLSISIVWQARKERAKAGTVVELAVDGRLAIARPGEVPRPVVKGQVMGTALVMLRAAPPGYWATRDLLLAPDSTDADGLRAIRQAVLTAAGVADAQ